MHSAQPAKQISRRGGKQMGAAYDLQMTHFMGGYNDAAEAACVFNDGHRVDLFQPLVDHTGAAHIRKS